jgi:hypothetical protein
VALREIDRLTAQVEALKGREGLSAVLSSCSARTEPIVIVVVTPSLRASNSLPYRRRTA